MSTLLEPVQRAGRSIMNRVAKGLNDFTGGKLHPDSITITSFVMHLPIAIFIARGQLVLGGLLLLFFGLFDALDGALARLQKRSSHFGMFLDSVTDRLKEVLIYTGIAYYLTSINEQSWLVWVVAAVGVSVVISYINAWGEVVVNQAGRVKQGAVNKRFRGGIMSFDVRMFCLIVGLLFNILPTMLLIIVTLGTLTVIDRMWTITQRLR